jgi:hypothetical protein
MHPSGDYGDPVYAPGHDSVAPLPPPVAPPWPVPGPPPRPPEQPPGTRRRWRWTAPRIVLAVLVLLLVCGGAVVLLTRGSGAAPRVRLPQSFAGYQLLHNGTDDSLRRKMAGQVRIAGIGDAIFDHASIGAYARNTGDQPALVVITMPRKAFRALGTGDDAETVTVLLRGAAPDATAFASGTHGGAVRCGPVSGEDVPVSACAWADRTTAGVLVVGYPPLSAAKAARLTNTLRDAID